MNFEEIRKAAENESSNLALVRFINQKISLIDFIQSYLIKQQKT
jgi:hypothetical protein